MPISTVSPSWTRIFDERAGDRRRDLGVDLVRRDLDERLVDLDGVALFLEPGEDRPLDDGLPHLRHLDLGGHVILLD